ncbi:MAG TPA: penicillin-binding transpeptidase domain-containing protein [Actinomycetes bacterium]|nr:penicillin-binding transpeptidase domain-containing protein [Actinomycetes bacterium]
MAGKTGTADLPPQAPFAWFASYAPAGDPRYVVVVIVEQGGHGGESAARWPGPSTRSCSGCLKPR